MSEDRTGHGAQRSAAVQKAVVEGAGRAVADAGAGRGQRQCRKQRTRRIGCTLSSIGRRDGEEGELKVRGQTSGTKEIGRAHV